MLQLSRSLLSIPVLSMRLGGPIATAVEPIINPHNLKILGWWCSVPKSKVQLILLVDDIREVLPEGLAVDDEAVLSEPNELIRHQEVLGTHFHLLDKEVRTKRGKLGKVSDYAYDSGGFVINKLYVSRPLTKLLAQEDTLIVDRSQIIEITDKFILVRDAEVMVTDEEEMEPSIEAAPAA
jgi:hypothetical protein